MTACCHVNGASKGLTNTIARRDVTEVPVLLSRMMKFDGMAIKAANQPDSAYGCLSQPMWCLFSLGVQLITLVGKGVHRGLTHEFHLLTGIKNRSKTHRSKRP